MAALAAGLGLAGWGRAALAGLFFQRHEERKIERRNDRSRERGSDPLGPPRTFSNTFDRAGFPQMLSNHAIPTNTINECGHYVGGGGGGLLHRAGPRCVNEGTWGWDYVGRFPPRRVFPAWNHGRRYQGGTGRYRTDPPFEIPNIFETELPKLHHRGEGE
jgi:hypothetical protein